MRRRACTVCAGAGRLTYCCDGEVIMRPCYACCGRGWVEDGCSAVDALDRERVERRGSLGMWAVAIACGLLCAILGAGLIAAWLGVL